jgi:hypothetical protein
VRLVRRIDERIRTPDSFAVDIQPQARELTRLERFYRRVDLQRIQLSRPAPVGYDSAFDPPAHHDLMLRKRAKHNP